ncbi:MAG: hypothetical protein R3C44_24900 [Chloroflexota bacterium]
MAPADNVHQPTEHEVERLRLILSTFQDGMGQLNNGTLPGWRDFERATAVAFGGTAYEGKGIYDVLVPSPNAVNVQFGIACKMRSELRRVDRASEVYIEVSNAAGEFWDTLNSEGINEDSLEANPNLAGELLIQVVDGWHEAVDVNNGGNIDSSMSSYLILQWDTRALEYQLFQYPIDLPDAHGLNWEVSGRRLRGKSHHRVLFEWYFKSGGQLKYYPPIEEASWHSRRFRLEPLPTNIEAGLESKAATYFPDIWK